MHVNTHPVADVAPHRRRWSKRHRKTTGNGLIIRVAKCAVAPNAVWTKQLVASINMVRVITIAVVVIANILTVATVSRGRQLLSEKTRRMTTEFGIVANRVGRVVDSRPL